MATTMTESQAYLASWLAMTPALLYGWLAASGQATQAIPKKATVLCTTLEETASLLESPVPLNVQSLSVVGPLFDDVALVRFFDCKHLMHVELNSTAVTPEAIALLKARLPTATVTNSYRWATDVFKSCQFERKGLTFSYNPVAIIRATNFLRSQSHNGAIDFLRYYVSHSKNSDQDCLLLIIPLCFESKDDKKDNERGPKSTIYEWSRAVDHVIFRHNDYSLFDSGHIIKEDIPFLPLRHYGMGVGGGVGPVGERPTTRSYLVEWAFEKGRLRRTRLSPGCPRRAADQAIAELTRMYPSDGDLFRDILSRQSAMMGGGGQPSVRWSDAVQSYVALQRDD